MEQKPIERIRSLTRALIISGALNILLGSLFLYWYNRDLPPPAYFELKPPKQNERQTPLVLDQKNSEWIRRFKALSFEQLIELLNRTEHIEEGYTQRDLALAVLVTFHHFDLLRALSGQIHPLQPRTISYGVYEEGNVIKVMAYPGLTDGQYASIIQFFRTERWPLTPRGIFLLLQDNQDKRKEESLCDAFSLTPEFRVVENLFNRSENSWSKKMLMQVTLEGNWQMLSSFVEQQKKGQDLSSSQRHAFLLNYIQHGSQTAAKLMLKHEEITAVKKLDDQQIKILLQLISPSESTSEQLALALLASPRSDEIWQLAAQKLYDYALEKATVDQYQEIFSTFMPKTHTQKPAQKDLEVTSKTIKQVMIKPIPPQRERIHIVQEGDSLWKIAKKYKTDIEVLKTRNQLKSDTLKLGIALKIP